jgi:competence ComEA-like helix-hairpin-helix protein
MAATAVLMAGYLLVRTYAVPDHTSELPVVLGQSGEVYSGVFVLDPNSAPVDSLELLPGVGPVLAERIDVYRQQHRFETVNDLVAVRGIGPKTLERLRPYLRIH